MQEKETSDDSRTDWEGRRDGTPKRSRKPAIFAAIALAVAAVFLFFPDLRSSGTTDSSAEGSSSAAAEIPFEAALVVEKVSAETIAYTVDVGFKEELVSLNYELELQDTESEKRFTLPTGSCSSSFGENSIARTCQAPIITAVTTGSYILKVILNDIDGNTASAESAPLQIR